MNSRTALIVVGFLATLATCQNSTSMLTNTTDLVSLNFSGSNITSYGTEIPLTYGQVFQVVLDENPTTGLIWNVSLSDLAANNLTNVITIKNSSFVSNNASVAGASGKRTLQFNVLPMNHLHSNLTLFNAKPSDLAAANANLSSFTSKTIPIHAIPATMTMSMAPHSGHSVIAYSVFLIMSALLTTLTL